MRRRVSIRTHWRFVARRSRIATMRYARRLLPFIPYALLSALILGPLLMPGFVLTMDMVFTPALHIPSHVDNTWLFYTILHVLNFVLPADFIEKFILLTVLI